MPAKLREEIGDRFIITKGLDGCLYSFSPEEWKNFEEKLRKLPLASKDARDFMRFFLSGATECEIDKQGRFLISNTLREYSKLEKDVIIIGVLTKLEIWDKEKWEEKNSQISADEIADKMFELGI